MKPFLRIAAALCVSAGGGLAQAPIAGEEAARAKALLHSFVWSEKAWGAYLIADLRSEESSGTLTEELQLAQPLRDFSGGTAEYAYVQVLLDSLIRSGALVPADLILPFEDHWRAETLILLSRSNGMEDALLERRPKLGGAYWLAAGNLLLRLHSGRFLAELLKEVPIVHTFYIRDDAETGEGGSAGSGGGACGDGVIAFPEGFPPVGKYDLVVSPQEGDMLAIRGPRDVYYRRTVATRRQIAVGQCDGLVDQGRARLEYLAAAEASDVAATTRLFDWSTTINWQTAEQTASEIRSALDRQAAAIRAFAGRTKNQGWTGFPGVSLQIEPTIKDRRGNRLEALPAVIPLQFSVE